jgi:hypothetical protein
MGKNLSVVLKRTDVVGGLFGKSLYKGDKAFLSCILVLGCTSSIMLRKKNKER